MDTDGDGLVTLLDLCSWLMPWHSTCVHDDTRVMRDVLVFERGFALFFGRQANRKEISLPV